ncbi:hypothetical protein KY335_03910 [Candidatus Woesearchaeota archaeon]|nr:hypothetical protein [Candidatus Woesearchaeota archaeon]
MRKRFRFIGTTLGFIGLGLGFLIGSAGCSKEDEEPIVPVAEQYVPAERNLVTNESTTASPLEFLAVKPGTNKNTRLIYLLGIDNTNNKVTYEVMENNVPVEKTSDFNPNNGVGVFDLGTMTVSYRLNFARTGLNADVNKDGDITADALTGHISIEGLAVPLNGSFQLQPRTDLGTYWERSDVPFPMVYTFVGLSADKSAIVLKDDSDGLTEFDISTGLISTYMGQHPFRLIDTPNGPRLYVDLNADGDLGLDPLEGQPFITEELQEIREGNFFYIGDSTVPNQFPLVYRLKQIRTMSQNGADELEFVDPNGSPVVVDYDSQTGQGSFMENGNTHVVMVNTTQGYIVIDLDASGLMESGRDLAANNTNITAPRVSDETTIVQNGGYTFTKIALGVPRLAIYSKDTATPPNHTMTDVNGANALTFATVDGQVVATYSNPDGAQIRVVDEGAGVSGDWNANNYQQNQTNVTRR